MPGARPIVSQGGGQIGGDVRAAPWRSGSGEAGPRGGGSAARTPREAHLGVDFGCGHQARTARMKREKETQRHDHEHATIYHNIQLVSGDGEIAATRGGTSGS
eukprot:277962-Pyramimonas_sp.AAC.2